MKNQWLNKYLLHSCLLHHHCISPSQSRLMILRICQRSRIAFFILVSSELWLVFSLITSEWPWLTSSLDLLALLIFGVFTLSCHLTMFWIVYWTCFKCAELLCLTPVTLTLIYLLLIYLTAFAYGIHIMPPRSLCVRVC